MKKKISLILLLTLMIQIFPCGQGVFATTQEKPGNVRVKEVDGEYVIGYNSDSQDLGYYADIEWDIPTFDGVSRYYNVYYKKNGESYAQYGSSILSSNQEIRLSQLDAGAIYHAYVDAVHVHADDDVNYAGQTHSSNATEDDEVLFLTGVDVQVNPAGTNEIDIIWDDVKYNGSRIGYEIYISQSKDFATTVPIEVLPQDVSSSGAIQPYGNNQLIYTAKNKSPGTVYYVKILPIVSNQEIAICPETKVAIGYTYIPATMSRVSAGDDYDIWKMQWERVTSSVSGTDETEYVVMQKQAGDVWQNIGGQTDVIRYIKVNHGEESDYSYKVRVYIQNEYDEYGYQLYIESDVLYTFYSEVPYNPTIPDIEYTIVENEEETIEIGTDSIKVIWYAPTGSDGDIDTEILYDIWLTTESSDLDNTDISPTIQNFNPSSENYVYEMIGDSLTDNIVAYKYTFESLEPNTVYYIKLIAKKQFLVEVDGSLEQVYYTSEPAIEMILTDSGSIDQPTAPAKPPFSVKIDDTGNPYVTTNEATVEWYSGWDEYKDDDGEWIPITEDNIDSVPDDVYRQRTIQYDEDIRFAIGYIELEEDLIDYSTIRDMPLQVVGLDNPYGESQELIEYTLTDLDPNTMYLVWLRAYRDINYLSEPSDPVIITTDIDYTIPLEKPSVPEWTVGRALDNNEGIELGWDRTTERNGLAYTYYLKWGTEDIAESATEEVEIPSSYFDTTDVYLAENLESETMYYFWISAEVENDAGETQRSDWSDSKLITTTEYIAPDTPTGFGIKNAGDAIGKNHITYEWNMEENTNYALEIATNSEYEDAQTFDISGIDEFMVDNLTSNQRYYARLYAVDPETELVSYPTQSISVKTLRSGDDYDSNQNIEIEITGPYIEDGYDRDKDEWVNEIIGVNADRFLEKVYTDHVFDYTIDMSDPRSSYSPLKSRRVSVSYKVFKGLSQIKENLIIDIGEGVKFLIRPHVLDVPELTQYFDDVENIVVDLTFDDSVSTSEVYQPNISPIEMVQLDIEVSDGDTDISLTILNRPIKMTMTYDENYSYYESRIEGARIESDAYGSEWDMLPTNAFVNDDGDGLVTFETKNTGKMGIVRINNTLRFVDIYGHWAQNDIITIFSKYEIGSISDNQTYFNPDQSITVKDTIKMILDVLEAEYNTNTYMETAYKAGLTRLVTSREYITRQEAIAILMRLYEIKTGEAVEAGSAPITQYKDVDEIDAAYKEILQFASQKGFIIGKSAQILAPTDKVTRAEFIAMLRRVLGNIGEI